MTDQAIRPADDHLDIDDVEAADQGDLHRLDRQPRRVVRLLRLHGVRAVFRAGVLPQQRPGGAAAQRRGAVRGDFLMRPLGGWLFGYLADRYGRRLSLTLSVVCMCFGSLIIAVTPTYATIGIAAPAILALARMIEGLSLGGEYGASATYLSEVADPKHRGFYSSFQYVTLIGGQLTAIIVLLLLQKVFLTGRATEGLGLAHSVRDRRAARDLRRRDAPRPARDRRVRRSQEGREAERFDPRRCCTIRANCCWWSASPPAAPRRSIPSPPTCRPS